ncbi:MAG: hypothetical protein JXB32_22380 [Deltaproteobacteria bacterium]|nr:hypothetical protein [Deltaproteobacteria bacterium]
MRSIPLTLTFLAAALTVAGCPVPADRPTVVQPPTPAPTIEPTPAPQYPPPEGVAVPVETGPLPPNPAPTDPDPTTTAATTTTTTTPGPLVIGTPAPPLPDPPPDPIIDPYSAVTAVPGGARPVRVTMHGVILPGAGRPAYVPPPPTAIGYAASRLILSNDSGLTICRLWLSPTADGVWGNELLGGQPMPPGSELAVSIDPSWAAWDLLAQDCNGFAIHDQRGRPLPSDGVWSIRPMAASAPAMPAGPPPPTVVY